MLDMHSNSLVARSDKVQLECAADDTLFNQRTLTGRKISSSLQQRGLADFYDPSIQFWSTQKYTQLGKRSDTQGCPKSRLINYMGAAADCTYTAAYQGIQNARIQMINDWNTASSVYERTFNVSLGIIQFYMMAPSCPTLIDSNNTWNQNCSSTYTINSRLSDFSIWRGARGNDGAGLWHLMTQCFTGVKVGIAWLSQLCETGASEQLEADGSSEWVSGTGVSSITLDEWKVVAHEIGHGFGAIHDCTAQLCPCNGDCNCCPLSYSQCDSGGTYIMNPTSNVSTSNFSPCSIADICNSLPNIGYCLQTPGTRKIETFSMCGNGILESGEECDSGGVDDACCHGATCKLKTGAVCDKLDHRHVRSPRSPPGMRESSHVSRLEAGSTRSSQNVGIETPLPAYGRNRLSAAGAEEWEMLPTNTGHHSRSSSVAPVPSLQNQDEASTQSSISTNLRISNPHSLKTFPVSRRMTTVSIASADSDTYLPPKHQVVNIAESQDSTV
ncbi:hypothetical protein VKS41_001400 [Umbelopsis sp. WA50703]